MVTSTPHLNLIRREGMQNQIPATAPRAADGSRLPTFIDVFAGCGGLGLGLMRAGWQGLFAIEKDKFAFETFSANLLGADARHSFAWPDWLTQRPRTVATCLKSYRKHLALLKGKVDMLVGGPPCQGFSSAGRRDPNDPRNRLVSDYIRLVHLIEPTIVLIENVRGFTLDFEDNQSATGRVNHAARLQESLSENYTVFNRMVDVSRFGVPQRRTRFFIIAFRNGRLDRSPPNPFEALEDSRLAFLRVKGLTGRVSAQSAISDLELTRNGKSISRDTEGFEEIAYKRPMTKYQKLMHDGFGKPPSDTRLPRHRPDIAQRFEKIIALCQADSRLNISLDNETRASFGLKKRALRVLDPDAPSPTITSMPDDLLHYSEPRTLTVRENARLQGFPDWFVFKGKYTTGGELRRQEVPRYTQVANAVPPLIAEAIGRILQSYISPARTASRLDAASRSISGLQKD